MESGTGTVDYAALAGRSTTGHRSEPPTALALAMNAGSGLGLKGLVPTRDEDPCGNVVAGSPDTRVEGSAVARKGDRVNHERAFVRSGAAGVTVNGRAVARGGDPSSCEGRIASASSSVVIVDGGVEPTFASVPMPTGGMGDASAWFARTLWAATQRWFVHPLEASAGSTRALLSVFEGLIVAPGQDTVNALIGGFARDPSYEERHAYRGSELGNAVYENTWGAIGDFICNPTHDWFQLTCVAWPVNSIRTASVRTGTQGVHTTTRGAVAEQASGPFLGEGHTIAARAAAAASCPSGACRGAEVTLGKEAKGKKKSTQTNRPGPSELNPAYRLLRDYPERLGRGGESWVRANDDEVVKLRMRHPWWMFPDEPEMYTPRMSRLEVTERSELYVQRVRKLREDPELARVVPETRHVGQGLVVQKRVRGISYEELQGYPDVTDAEIRRLDGELARLRALAKKQLQREPETVVSKDGLRAYDVGLDFTADQNVLYTRDATGKWRVSGVYDPVGVGDASHPPPNVAPALSVVNDPASGSLVSPTTSTRPFLRRDGDGHLYGLGDESTSPNFTRLPTLRDSNGEPVTRVVVHGNGAGVVGADGIGRSAVELSRELDRHGVQGPIWLVSCKTGKGEVGKPHTFGGAAELARVSGRAIVASDRSVSIGERGEIFHKPNREAPYEGMWFLFERDENGVVRRTPLRDTSLRLERPRATTQRNCVGCNGGTMAASSLAKRASELGFKSEGPGVWDKLREYPVRVGDTYFRGGSQHFVRATPDRRKYLKILRTLPAPSRVRDRNGDRVATRREALSRALNDEAGAKLAVTIERLREDPFLRERLPETKHLGGGVAESEGLPGVKYSEMAKLATTEQRVQAEKDAVNLIARTHERARTVGVGSEPSRIDSHYALFTFVDLFAPRSPNILYDFDPVSGQWTAYSHDPVAVFVSVPRNY